LPVWGDAGGDLRRADPDPDGDERADPDRPPVPLPLRPLPARGGCAVERAECFNRQGAKIAKAGRICVICEICG